MLYFWDTDNDTLYSTWNDLQRPLEVIGDVVLSTDRLDFLSDTWKVGYTYF